MLTVRVGAVGEWVLLAQEWLWQDAIQVKTIKAGHLMMYTGFVRFRLVHLAVPQGVMDYALVQAGVAATLLPPVPSGAWSHVWCS